MSGTLDTVVFDVLVKSGPVAVVLGAWVYYMHSLVKSLRAAVERERERNDRKDTAISGVNDILNQLITAVTLLKDRVDIKDQLKQ